MPDALVFHQGYVPSSAPQSTWVCLQINRTVIQLKMYSVALYKYSHHNWYTFVRILLAPIYAYGWATGFIFVIAVDYFDR